MSQLSELAKSLYTLITVTISLRSPIVGGIPTSEKLIDGWLKSKNIVDSEVELAKLKEATVSELGKVVAEKTEGMWTTFKRDSAGIYIEGRQVKAMFKESANILRDLLIKAETKTKNAAKKAGTDEGGRSRFTNLKSRLAERLFVVEDRIYFTRNGKKLTDPDESTERPIHVMTPQGPRTALKKSDLVNPTAAGFDAPTTLTFTCKMMNDGVIDQELVELLLAHSADNGLGADRSQGNGMFKVEKVTEVES